MHLLDGVLGATLWPVAIGIGIKVRLKDRFQQQLRGCLHHPVPNRRYPERPFAATGLGDHPPPHGLWFVRLGAKVVPDAFQPFLPPFRFDLLEALLIHARRAFVGLRQFVGMQQNVLAPHLVIEQVEAAVRLLLRFLIQLSLKHPDLNWCFQTHRQSPLLSFFESTSEVRALSSTGITRLPRSYGPLRLPA